MPLIINPSGGGGGGQTTTVANDTIWDAKGDIVVATGADAAARVAIGSIGDILKSTGSSTTAAWGKRPGYYKMPTGAIAETVSRDTLTQVTAPTTATITMTAIELEAGMVVNSFNFRTAGTGLSGGNNQWIALFDKSRVQLAVTADQALATLGTLTDFSWAVATIASGSASSYAVPTTDLYYVGVMFKATVVCNMAAAQTVTSQTAPILSGTSNAAQATPNAFPFTATALTSGGANYHVWLK